MQRGMHHVPVSMLSITVSVSSTSGLWLEEDPPRRWQGCPDEKVAWICGRMLCHVPWWRPRRGLVISMSLCLEEQSLEPVPSWAPQDSPPSWMGGSADHDIPWG